MNKPLVDSRRFTLPPDAKDYRVYSSKKDNASSKSQYRLDGEREKDISVRPLFCEVGILTQSKGSAYLERGRTKVLASVFGPREVSKKLDFSSTAGSLNVEYKEAPFASRSDGRGEAKERDVGLFLAQTLRSTVCLHLYPKSRIDVCITVLEDDGSAIPTAITAAALALSDASINLFDLVIGASVKLCGGKALSYPCKAEEGIQAHGSNAEENQGHIIIGYQPSLEQIAALLQDGVLESSALSSQMRSLIKAAEATLPSVQECLMRSLSEKLKEMNTDK
uniref:Exosome complex exonuclease MTR3 n=1 Tax=Caligus rogercresseyi TaxID=217165 RepID=C1BMH5_CALRO|nr:Exosome complex exonuclease MTR3 [Caligus rogercresseyi]